jgi:uncharacterized protein
MAMLARIEEDFKLAFRNKEELKLSVLRLLKSAIKNLEIEKRGQGNAETLSEDDLAKVVKRELKKREEAIITFRQGDREELATKEQAELEILKQYAPAEMSETEIKTIVSAVISENNFTAKDFGQAMKLVMAKTNGQADGKIVSRLVKESLGN